jgi:hypothetical protein
VIYPVSEDRGVIEVKIAAGSEKKDWLEEAARRFMADPALNSGSTANRFVWSSTRSAPSSRPC